jgi:predicted transglutaminase-like cysteine proteinase
MSKEQGTSGIFTKMRILFARNRLGELLVLQGLLTPVELRHALARQKSQNIQLGRLLLQEQMVSRRALYRILAQQWTVRCMAAAVTITLSMSSMGIKPARAGAVKDLPAHVLTLVSTANSAFRPIGSHTPLFGSEEKRSYNLSPFTKWTSMFDRFESTMKTSAGQNSMNNWKGELQSLSGLPLEAMAERVNRMVNEVTYIEDSNNWGKSDYWATPVEFFARGGDCEDFAIAKYTALRALGVPEERLRVAIVHDKKKDIPHAVLIVYTDNGALLLDNQNQTVLNAATYNRYRPIFSINRQAWWLHNQGAGTVMASAE